MKLSKAETFLSAKSWGGFRMVWLTDLHPYMPTYCKVSSDGPGVYGLSHISYGRVSPAVSRGLYLTEDCPGLCFQKPWRFKHPLAASRRCKITLQCCTCSVVEEKFADSHSNSNVTWSPHISFQHPFQEQPSKVKYFSLVLWRAPGDE